MPQQENDKLWVKAARSGDTTAFAALANKYKPLLIQFLLPYTHVLEDAEDLCQESLHRAFHNLEHYDPKYAFSTWLYNIARNAAIDHYRKQNASIPLTPVRLEDVEEGIDGQSESPEDSYIRNQTRQTIRMAIAALPEHYREAAELRFLKEFAYEEIANQLQLPLNTVRTRIRRARECLLQQVNTPNTPETHD